MLQNEGLIQSQPNRRVRVSELSLEDVEELYTIRIPLEVTALRLSLPRMTPEDIARLAGYLAEMAHFAGEQDYRRWHVPHRAFHQALNAFAGPRYGALLMQLFDHAERYRRVHVGRSFSKHTAREHSAAQFSTAARTSGTSESRGTPAVAATRAAAPAIVVR